ncbi:hypothetical protein AAMO2058_000399100 [Amorphochlora amoebiformis]
MKTVYVAIFSVAAVAGIFWLSTNAGQHQPALKAPFARVRGIQAQCPSVQRTFTSRALGKTPADLSGRLALPAGQCTGNGKVSVCNNGLVILRPSTAVRAEKSTIDADKIVDDLSAKWDKIENKSQVAVYAGGALVALVAANAVVTTIDNLPFLPYFTEVVGTCYSLWFAYKYLLFEESRKELVKDVEVLIEKVGGKTGDL